MIKERSSADHAALGLAGQPRHHHERTDTSAFWGKSLIPAHDVPITKCVQNRVHAGGISAHLLLDRALTSQHKSLFDGIGKQYACCRRLSPTLAGISIRIEPPGQFTRHYFSQYEVIFFFFLFEIIVSRFSRHVIAVRRHGYANNRPVDEITQISCGIAERERSACASCGRRTGE
jgi:hypothetical protein